MLKARKVARKTGKSTQYAALCFRMHKRRGLEILLVTSRGTGRWIPPKGWPIKGKSPGLSAAVEAFEEAGVRGRVQKTALGRYRYHQSGDQETKPASEAYIFPLEVRLHAGKFKEKGQRKIKWFSPKKAAKLVREPKLKKIIRGFDPTILPRPLKKMVK
ncbi:MAG: NUDIX hydrolase [Alphaproteobacteria bacterium]|nr:NUDIX hydrolase [Alphaproteobacteria bacterium]